MLVTVTERTREIGIMKALGFSSMDILLLFLVESIIISLFGGLLELGLGIGGVFVATTVLKLPFFYSPFLFKLGLTVAMIVGVLAGVYPASKAAKLAPMDALRYVPVNKKYTYEINNNEISSQTRWIIPF